METRLLAGWASIAAALALWAVVLGAVASPLGEWLSRGGLERPAATASRERAAAPVVILRASR